MIFMASSHEEAASSSTLRARAEKRLRTEAEDTSHKTPQEMQELLHELRVHQIELEMQNDQLKVAQEDLERQRERYITLYDFAPVGYLSITREGLIRESNLTAVSLLGVERSRLNGLPLSQFVYSADQEIYYLCWRRVFEKSGTQSCEIRFRPANGIVFHGRVEGIQAMEDGREVCHLAMIDITRQKQVEAALRDSERRRITYENEEWKRLALEAGELGAWDQDLQTGRITYSSQA